MSSEERFKIGGMEAWRFRGVKEPARCMNGISATADFREPTAQGLLDGDHGDGNVLICVVEFLEESQTRCAAVGQSADVIGVQYEHVDQSLSACFLQSRPSFSALRESSSSGI